MKVRRCFNCSHARSKHRFTDLRGLTNDGAYYSGCYLCECQEYQSSEPPDVVLTRPIRNKPVLNFFYNSGA